jgi:hypothetical protein
MAVCNILWALGKFYEHLVHFVLIWYIFSGFGITYQEKSGNPGPSEPINLAKVSIALPTFGTG